MTPPSVLVNTYIKTKDKPSIDMISKFYIISELFFGIIRLSLFGNVHILFMILSIAYSVILMSYYTFLLYRFRSTTLLLGAISFHFIECSFFIIFNLFSIKRLQSYYNELDVFDKEVGCRPRIGKGSKWNLILTIVVMVYMLGAFLTPNVIEVSMTLYIGIVPFALCHILEVHFCGHLLSLLVPRLRLMNYYMELSLSTCIIRKAPNIEEFGYSKADSDKSLCKIEKMMNLYHNMIKAYNYLIDAIKWQLLVTVVTTFGGILLGVYKVSLAIIKHHISFSFMLCFMVLIAGLLLPWFAPCVFADQIHCEVRRLRKLLASRLYENHLDKSGRRVARALLAWTEKKNMSFSLLHILDIDVSLPFKFVGLVVTYLVILLQFQKIINP